MAIFRRNKTYWTDFSVNGHRYRQSLRTTDWREAQSRQMELIVEASQGNMAPSSQRFARLAFSEAADRYLAERKAYLAPLSIRTEKERLRPLKLYFGAMVVSRISPESVLSYIAYRKEAGISNRTVNMDISALRRVLKRAKRWHLIADEIKPLREESTVGQALTHGEKVRLLRKASERPEWETAYWAAILTLNTTMRGCELRGLRWLDIDLIERILIIPKSKTPAGERVIPLTEEAYLILLKLRKRAEMFGPVEPSHYVFAAMRPRGRFHGNKIVEMRITDFDPTRSVKSWRTAWRTLTKKAGLSGVRFHDMRHQLITELGESGASDQIIMAIAGHVSRKMLDRYSHPRLEAKRQALEKALGKQKKQSPEWGYVTKNGTKSGEEETRQSQVIENAGGDDGTRTRDLMRDSYQVAVFQSVTT